MFEIKKPLPPKSLLAVLCAALFAVTALTVPLFAVKDSTCQLYCGAPVENAFAQKGYGLYVDGVFIAAAESADGADAAIEEAANTLAKAYGAPQGTNSLLNVVDVTAGVYLKDTFASSEDIAALLGCSREGVSNSVYTVNGELTNIVLNVNTVTTVTVEETVKADYVSVGTDLLENGTEVVVKEKEDGVELNEYAVTYVNGEKTEALLLNSTTVSEPVAGEKWYGTDEGATLMSAGDKLMLPCTGWVTSWYGSRYVFGSSDNHGGIDFAGEGGRYGDPIYAAEDGVVSYADWHGAYGKKITVDHSKELSTIYAHCSNIIVNVGDTVRKGQIIGYIGATGRVTGAHLHFEVWKNGVKTNPKEYLDWSVYQWGE